MSSLDEASARSDPGWALMPWWLLLLEGIAALLLGILLFTDTAGTLFTVMIFLGVYWFITGIFELVMMFVDRRQWGWKLFSGIVGILAGIVVLRDPLWAAVLIPTTLAWLIGVAGVAIGIVAIIRAVTGAGWGAALFGVVAILLGLLVLFHAVFTAVVFIYAVAILAVIGGIITIIGAIMLRSSQHSARAGAPVGA